MKNFWWCSSHCLDGFREVLYLLIIARVKLPWWRRLFDIWCFKRCLKLSSIRNGADEIKTILDLWCLSFRRFSIVGERNLRITFAFPPSQFSTTNFLQNTNPHEDETFHSYRACLVRERISPLSLQIRFRGKKSPKFEMSTNKWVE